MLVSILPLVTLAFTAAFTPGPNNVLLANSGAKFGYIKTLPHILGVAFGFSLMVLIVGLFLGEIFQRSLFLRDALRWGGAALLLYIAVKVASSGGLGRSTGEARPFTFIEAAGFQWINPKGWAMSIAVTAQYVSEENTLSSAITVALVFIFAGLSSASTWAIAGKGIRRWINTSSKERWFNITMGLMIAGCVVLLFLD